MRSFEYHRPGALSQATGLLATDQARPLAGGMTLLPTLKLRLAAPAALVDLSAIAGLSGIEATATQVGAPGR